MSHVSMLSCLLKLLCNMSICYYVSLCCHVTCQYGVMSAYLVVTCQYCVMSSYIVMSHVSMLSWLLKLLCHMSICYYATLCRHVTCQYGVMSAYLVVTCQYGVMSSYIIMSHVSMLSCLLKLLCHMSICYYVSLCCRVTCQYCVMSTYHVTSHVNMVWCHHILLCHICITTQHCYLENNNILKTLSMVIGETYWK